MQRVDPGKRSFLKTSRAEEGQKNAEILDRGEKNGPHLSKASRFEEGAWRIPAVLKSISRKRLSSARRRAGRREASAKKKRERGKKMACQYAGQTMFFCHERKSKPGGGEVGTSRIEKNSIS